jgi:hypothetical protein
MRLPRKITGLLMAAGMAVGITTAAAPAHADPLYFVIATISGSTGHCLDVPMDQTLSGLWMQLYGCNGTYAQEFWSASV